jgi:hypothetical protein
MDLREKWDRTKSRMMEEYKKAKDKKKKANFKKLEKVTNN